MDPYDKPPSKSPHYSLYQREVFANGPKGILPPCSADPTRLEAEAKEALTNKGYWYSSSNAGLSWTDAANREAFYAWRIKPRMLVDTNVRDMRVNLFGHDLPNPLIFAPVGINKIYHPEGELIPSSVAGELGMAYCLSTAASQSIEDVAKANGPSSPRFFQLYMGHDDDVVLSLLNRAHNNGFDVCMLTLDTWQLAWRPTDIDIANYAFYSGIGNEMGKSDPVFMKKYGEELKKDPGRWIDSSVWHGKAHTWEKACWAREQWQKISGGRPFLLKGIQTVEDAKKAVELGFEGIVVSNHAGRQVDGAVGSLEMLPAIVDALPKDYPILYDSGIRTGADIFKAIALGAKAVLFGRIWIYGTAFGRPGCLHVTKSLLADLDILMTVAGYPDLKKIGRDDLVYNPSGLPSKVKL